MTATIVEVSIGDGDGLTVLSGQNKISKQSGIACSDMLFFDDEPHSNRDVCELGVVFQDIPSFSDTGTTVDLVLQGLEMYARSKQ